MAAGSTTPLVWRADEPLRLTSIIYANIVAVLSLEPTLTWNDFAAEVNLGLVSEQLRFFLFNPSNSTPGQMTNLDYEILEGSTLAVASTAGGSLGVVQLGLQLIELV
jgi:hypothetical protein